MLAKITDCPRKWDQVLNEVEFSLNNTINKATGKTPAILLFGMNQIGKINDH